MPTHAIATTGEVVDPTTGKIDGYMTKYKSYAFLITQEISAQSSGSLVVGQVYKINDYHEGDDFTNVGAAQNANDEIFTATDTTPTSWGGGTQLLNGLSPYIQIMNEGDSNYLGDVTWERIAPGSFRGTKTGAFPLREKFFPMSHDPYPDKKTGVIWGSEDYFFVNTAQLTENGWVNSDGAASYTPVKIDVYNP